ARLGTGSMTTAHDLTLSATAADEMTTTANAGVSGGGVTVAPAVAVAISNVASKAELGTGPLANASGAVSLTANTTATAITTASGDTTSSGSAAVGAAIALTFANHSAVAEIARAINAGGAVTLSATGPTAVESNATASASGAPGNGAPGSPAGGVDGQVASERASADAKAGAAGGSGA